MSTESTALSLIEKTPSAELFKPGFLDPVIGRIREEAQAEASKYDISSDMGRKGLASLAFKIARSKTFLDKQGKELVSEEKKRLSLIDKERSRVWDELESLQREVRKPLTDWEDAEKKRVADHEAALEEIVFAGPYSQQNWRTLPVESMSERISEILADGRDWQEFSSRAQAAKNRSVLQIQEALSLRQEFEEGMKELERLKEEQRLREQKEREERIAAEAKASAEREALAREQRILQESQARENAAQQEKEAAERRAAQAEADKLAAEERAEKQKEQAVADERRRATEEQQLIEEESRAREADKKHKASVNNDAAKALMEIVGLSEETAKAVVTAICKSQIPHVKVAY